MGIGRIYWGSRDPASGSRRADIDRSPAHLRGRSIRPYDRRSATARGADHRRLVRFGLCLGFCLLEDIFLEIDSIAFPFFPNNPP